MTQAWHRPAPGPPHLPAVAGAGQAQPSQRLGGPRGSTHPEKGPRARRPRPKLLTRRPSQPRHVQDCVSKDWSGQGWGRSASSPGAFHTSWKESSQALEARGGTCRLSRRFPAPSRVASSTGVLFGQGASPACYRGQALRTRAPKGTAERPRTWESERPCFGLGSTMRRLRRDWTSETVRSPVGRGSVTPDPPTPPPWARYGKGERPPIQVLSRGVTTAQRRPSDAGSVT